MAKIKKINWFDQRGYSIEETLKYHGLGFEGFDILERAMKGSSERVKKKIIGELGKDLRQELLEENDFSIDADMSKINDATYVICLGGPFELQYEKEASRVLYIGSGKPYRRIKSHLSGKLFEFAETIPSLKLRFFIANLDHEKNARDKSRYLEQSLLIEFKKRFDESLPLLNKISAKKDMSANYQLPPKWDKPLHRSGKKAEWKLTPSDFKRWKGVLS